MDPESLIKILRAHDASFGPAAVRAVLQQHPWALLHLTPDTLLSPDELSQYVALEQSGITEKLASSAHLSTTQALSDHDIRDAIDQLNRSTQAITKQTETLKQQHEALDRLVSGDRRARQERAIFESEQKRKWDSRRLHLATQVEELSQSLDSHVLELEQQSGTGAASSLEQTVDSLFRSDDTLLSSLQKLGWELETEDPEEKSHVVMLRETCARLIKFIVEGLRTKLDRVYLECLEEAKNSRGNSRVAPGEVTAMQEELESLYSEILPVAQMSVEQQFLEPALKKVEARNGQSQLKSKQATEYIHDCLDYLLDHVQDLSARVEAYKAYQAAAGTVLDVAKSELAIKVDLRKSQASESSGNTSQRSAFESPVRPRPKQKPTRRYSGIGGEEPPLDEILRALAINLSEDEEDVQAQIKALANILTERRRKTDDVAKNVQESFEETAIKQIADGRLAIQLVRDSILAESPFGEVRLIDPEIEGSIAVLSQELEEVRKGKEAVEADMAKLRTKSAKKEELISRWGS
ncbi:hypothetical protein QBC38DRAFT_44142 [Podospora fimiseda]|uniref:HAUS augmin-like complex subunit 3 N-terminal domain-containing protein n=1 Tax=Podospora fimiseda TaxID=252190 RepID=A0AAN7GSM9_9PEZI|nr:hypothetical protein QBC38DRAFT_44142 [Podospora fimiseda]